MSGGEDYPTVVWQVHFEEDRAFFYMVLEHLSPGREFAPAGREFHLDGLGISRFLLIFLL